MKNKLLFCAIVALAQTSSAFMVSVPIETPAILFPLGFATGSTSGHEEITRQAMNRLESSLLSVGIDAAKISPEFLGDREVSILSSRGLNTSNMIIKGNYSTDMPAGLVDIFNVPEFHDQVVAGWTNNPNVQVLHFLRNINPEDGSLYSQFDTCNLAKEQILKSTIEGLKRWNNKDQKTALFLFGHATHTIQDSFSHAHTLRDRDANGNKLLKICYYGPQRKVSDDACYHDMIDIRDDIWFSNPLFAINAFSNLIPIEALKEANLKAEAKLARTATMRYLYLIATYIKNESAELDEADVRKTLNDKLFEGLTGMLAVDQGAAVGDPNAITPMQNGIIRCEGLSPRPDLGGLLTNSNNSNGQ